MSYRPLVPFFRESEPESDSLSISPNRLSNQMSDQITSMKDKTSDVDDDLKNWIERVRQILSETPVVEPKLPCQILPWLWLSSQVACTPSLAEELGITHVMTMNALPPAKSTSLEWSWREVGVDHTYVPAYDCEGYNLIAKHWESTCRPVLEGVRSSGGESKIVVHCVAGQNRSGLIVAAALLELEQRPLLEVVRYLKEKRGLLLTNASFRQELCQLAQQLGLLGE